jgi:hypothetical protein
MQARPYQHFSNHSIIQSDTAQHSIIFNHTINLHVPILNDQATTPRIPSVKVPDLSLVTEQATTMPPVELVETTLMTTEHESDESTVNISPSTVIEASGPPQNGSAST